jgi:hypothetical protein
VFEALTSTQRKVLHNLPRLSWALEAFEAMPVADAKGHLQGVRRLWFGAIEK